MNKLKEYFSYRKFTDSKVRIIYLYNEYWLQREIISCLGSLGHNIYTFYIIDDPKKMLDGLLKACIEFKPDIIMGTNHMGFDPEGKIANILSELNLPVTFWYLDDFRFIIQQQNVHFNENTALFSFDEKHNQYLKKLGVSHSFYLPLAATFDPEINYGSSAFSGLNNSVTFIGNSFQETVKKWQRPGYKSKFKQVSARLNISESIPGFVEEINRLKLFSSENDSWHFCGYAAAAATQAYRQNYLVQIPEDLLQIYGDSKWNDLGVTGKINPPTDYQKITPQVYSNSMININLSSQQLDSAVNQRVFDVPASGGFLLTDFKNSLPQLFDIESEIACFNSNEEMLELINYYSRHESERNKIVDAARWRINKEHMLIHRAEKMLDHIIQIFR